jgi:hypothetical protein
MSVLPFRMPPTNQFKRPHDLAELARWGIRATRYRHGVYCWSDHPDPRQRGWIQRTDDGDEHVLICGPAAEIAFMVRVERGDYQLRDADGRRIATYDTLQGALEAIVPTLRAA